MDNSVKGQIHGIKLDSFLQMVQMEKTTCTLNVKTADESGLLYILKGELIDAETGDLKHLKAALKIISWDNSVIDIENACHKKENNISQSLINILLQVSKLKDEKQIKPAAPKTSEKKPKTVPKKQVKSVGKKGKSQKPKKTATKDISTPAEKLIAQKVAPDIQISEHLLKEIQVPEKPRKNKLMLYLIAGAALLIIAVGGFFFMKMMQSNSTEKEFKKTMTSVDRIVDHEDKLKILNTYLHKSKDDKYRVQVQGKIKNVLNQIEEEKFNTTIKNAGNFLKKNNYEKALAVYRKYLEKYPSGRHSSAVKQKISHFTILFADRDFEKIISPEKNQDVSQKIALYLEYIKKYPGSKHKNAVKKLISNMSEEYYRFIDTQIQSCKAKKDWETCIGLCDSYINTYKGNKRSEKLKSFRQLFQQNLQYEHIFARLLATAEMEQTNYKKAKKIFVDYLRAYPESPLKSRLNKEIEKKDSQIKRARLQKELDRIEQLLLETKGRFVSNGDGTVTDKKTGLMWSALDSLIEKQECLDYKAVMEYVKGLSTGGHNDWRIPTTKELQKIYKTEPFFPSTGAKWYWSSESYSRYSDGLSRVVDIVTSKPETVIEKLQKDSRYCGAVHAVRP